MLRAAGKARALRACLVGLPNAGKSMLLNRLVGRKVVAESPKSHTTKRPSIGVVTKGTVQLSLVDTPGASVGMSREEEGQEVDPGQAWGERLNRSTRGAVRESDVALMAFDVARKPSPLTFATLSGIVQVCGEYDVEPLLCLTKADLLQGSGDRLQRRFEAWAEAFEAAGFAAGVLTEMGLDDMPVPRMFLTSGRTGDGVDALCESLMELAVPREWQYGAQVFTPLTSRELVQEIIREKLFKVLNKNVPHEIGIHIRDWQTSPRDGSGTVRVDLQLPRRAFVPMLTGRQAAPLRKIQESAQRDIYKALRQNVDLKLHLQYKPNMRRVDV